MHRPCFPLEEPTSHEGGTFPELRKVPHDLSHEPHPPGLQIAITTEELCLSLYLMQVSSHSGDAELRGPACAPWGLGPSPPWGTRCLPCVLRSQERGFVCSTQGFPWHRAVSRVPAPGPSWSCAVFALGGPSTGCPVLCGMTGEQESDVSPGAS